MITTTNDGGAGIRIEIGVKAHEFMVYTPYYFHDPNQTVVTINYIYNNNNSGGVDSQPQPCLLYTSDAADE